MNIEKSLSSSVIGEMKNLNPHNLRVPPVIEVIRLERKGHRSDQLRKEIRGKTHINQLKQLEESKHYPESSLEPQYPSLWSIKR